MNAPSQEDLRGRVLSRMKELSSKESRWHRALWTVATVTVLDELVEAAEHTWSGVLSTDHALSDFRRNAIRAVEADPGVGTTTLRTRLKSQITKVGPSGDVNSRNAVAQVLVFRRRIEREYLRNWASHIEDGQLSEDTVEIAARSVVTHIRSLGYSRDHIHKWLASRGSTLSVPELAREAAQNLDGTPNEYLFLVPSDLIAKHARREKTLAIHEFDDVEKFFGGATNATEVSYSGVEDRSAVEFLITAADPFSAISSLELVLDGIHTRIALSSGKAVSRGRNPVLETNANKIHELRKSEDLLRIQGLNDWKLLTSLDSLPGAASLTEALHLLAPHLQSTHGVSVATLWATAESLLGRAQQGGHHVARHLAEILSCAYPRHLAYDLLLRAKALKKKGVTLACRTTGKGTYGLRQFCDDLKNGNPGFTEPSDLAALARYNAVIAEPRETLKRVKQHLESLFLRVYYHRNFVMHSAKTNSISLLPIATIAPVLVAAALNEIVTGVARSASPTTLAERAAVELDLVGSDAQRSLLSLLT